MRTHYLTLFAGFILLASCNKTANFENLDLLTQKNWNLISIVKDSAVVSDSCDTDDVLYFENAKQFSYDFGNSNCNEENVLNRVGYSWKLTDDFAVIRLKYKFDGNTTKGSLVEYWEIIELSDSLLIVQDASAADNNQIPEVRTYE